MSRKVQTFLSELMKHYKWYRCAIISANQNLFSQSARHIQQVLEQVSAQEFCAIFKLSIFGTQNINFRIFDCCTERFQETYTLKSTVQ